MRRISCLLAIAAAFTAMAPAYATYTAISHNLLNGVADTNYNANTGEFRVFSTINNTLSLYDPGPATLTGSISNTVIDITTYFDQVLLGPSRANFTGGSLMLTFDYDADGAGGNPATSHQLGGPIGNIEFTISPLGPLWKMDGAGFWNATTINLPGSGSWPSVASLIDSLTIVFNQDLSNWDWENDSLTGRAETQYSLLPVPEPAGASLLVIGALALLRRR